MILKRTKTAIGERVFTYFAFLIPISIIFILSIITLLGSKIDNDRNEKVFYKKFESSDINDYSFNSSLLTHRLLAIDNKYGVANAGSYNKAISNVNAFLKSASENCSLSDKTNSMKNYVSCVNNVLGNNFYYTQSVDVSNNYAIHRSDCDTNTYLMMDALKIKGIQSYIVYAPGHAFLAWKDRKGNTNYQETTYNNNHGEVVNLNKSFYRKTFDHSYYNPYSEDVAENVYQALISDEAKNKVDLKGLFDRNKDNAFISDWYFTYKDKINEVNMKDVDFISDKLKLDITSNDKRMVIIRYLMKNKEYNKAKVLYEGINKSYCDKLCFLTGVELGFKSNIILRKPFLMYDSYMKKYSLGGNQNSFYTGFLLLILSIFMFICYLCYLTKNIKSFSRKVSFMKESKGDVQYYLNKDGDYYHLVKKIKTFSKKFTMGKTKSAMITIVDTRFTKDQLKDFDFTINEFREKDKEVIYKMIDELESNFAK